MLYGIGCDLCEVARMEKSLSGAHGPAFVRRVFGPAEQAALGLGAEATRRIVFLCVGIDKILFSDRWSF